MRLPGSGSGTWTMRLVVGWPALSRSRCHSGLLPASLAVTLLTLVTPGMSERAAVRSRMLEV